MPSLQVLTGAAPTSGARYRTRFNENQKMGSSGSVATTLEAPFQRSFLEPATPNAGAWTLVLPHAKYALRCRGAARTQLVEEQMQGA